MKIRTLLIIGFLFIPNLSFADGSLGVCSKTGYTIATLNGVFTDDKGARTNLVALSKIFGPVWNNQGISYQYLLNDTHLGGLGDLLASAYQKYFDSETVEDYDLVEMLKAASEKVTTQKLLLVGHSQGNFYANSFYDKVAGKNGGVPKESIGVYSVATPSGRVAGGGKWLTSDTDKVIAGAVARTPFRNIMRPNTHIELQVGDDSLGHTLSGVYLKYKGDTIISDIAWSLDKLTTNNTERTICIDPPKITVAHKAVGAMFAVADPVANASKKALVYSVGVAYRGSVFVVKVGVNTTAVATVWTYKTGVAAAKAAGNAVADVTGAAYSAVKSLVNGQNCGNHFC